MRRKVRTLGSRVKKFIGNAFVSVPTAPASIDAAVSGNSETHAAAPSPVVSHDNEPSDHSEEEKLPVTSASIVDSLSEFPASIQDMLESPSTLTAVQDPAPAMLPAPLRTDEPDSVQDDAVEPATASHSEEEKLPASASIIDSLSEFPASIQDMLESPSTLTAVQDPAPAMLPAPLRTDEPDSVQDDAVEPATASHSEEEKLPVASASIVDSPAGNVVRRHVTFIDDSLDSCCTYKCTLPDDEPKKYSDLEIRRVHCETKRTTVSGRYDDDGRWVDDIALVTNEFTDMKFYSYVEYVESFYETQDDVNKKNWVGWTLLMHAAAYTPAMIMVLVNYFGDKVMCNLVGAYEETALTIAVRSYALSVSLLIDNFRDVIDINHTTSSGETALMIAMHHSQSVFSLLVEKFHDKININHQDNEGYTALMIASRWNPSSLTLLVSKFRDKININLATSSGETAVTIAALSSSSALSFLINNFRDKIDINHQNKDGYSALMIASRWNPSSLNILIDAYEDVLDLNCVSIEPAISCNAFMLACRYLVVESVEILTERFGYRIRLNQEDSTGMSPAAYSFVTETGVLSTNGKLYYRYSSEYHTFGTSIFPAIRKHNRNMICMGGDNPRWSNLTRQAKDDYVRGDETEKKKFLVPFDHSFDDQDEILYSPHAFIEETPDLEKLEADILSESRMRLAAHDADYWLKK